jgi:hypothetical protein
MQTATTVHASKLRFPGEYCMAETGLNQNWNRGYAGDKYLVLQSLSSLLPK